MHAHSASYHGNHGREAGEGGRLTGVAGAWAAHLIARLRLSGRDYQVVRHVPLPTGGGSDALDRVVVSPYGVFVVETLRMKGRIYGAADQKAWIHQAGGQQHAIQNPLLPAARRARMLAAMLGLDAGKVYPVLTFAGGCSFEAEMPDNVTRGGGYARYIRSRTIPILTKADAARVVHLLEARIADERRGDEPAAKACPACGRDMVLRDAKRGDAAGKRFWVCSDFPTCRSALVAEPAPGPVPQPVPRMAPKGAPEAAPQPVQAREAAGDGEFGRPVLY